MEQRRNKIIPLLLLVVLLMCSLLQVGAEEETEQTGRAASGNDYKVEQIFINMPDVTAYYRCPAPDGNLEVYLGGKKLEMMENTLFSETGEQIEYYVLLDISASITRDRFQNIKESLTEFLNGLRENDSLVLMTFGDQATVVLEGQETREEAADAISQLENRDQNTVLFEAIDKAADMIVTAGDTMEKRRVMLVISDGKDCADDTRSMESVESGLIAKGIPLYSLAVENNEGDSEVEISNYRGKFSALSRNTGGIPWSISKKSTTVTDGLNQVRDTVMNSWRVKLLAASNRVSNQREDFVMKFLGAGNMTDTHSVLVGRGQRDEIAPTATIEQGEELNEIRITFSEPVLNAGTVSNYNVKRGSRSIPVKQVVYDSATNTARLIFDQDFYTDNYDIQLSNITDNSNEENPLANPSLTLFIDGLVETEPPTEPPVETETETEEQEDVWELVLKWWPIVLTVIFLILIIVLVVIVRKIKEKKGVLIVDDKIVMPDQVDVKNHVMMTQNPELPSKEVVLWLSNGQDEPKRLQLAINGSAIIGRSAQCDVYCDDPMMSRQHFVLEVDDGNIFLMDLETRNGTSVNGIEVKGRRKLETHDEITAGNIRFRIEF